MSRTVCIREIRKSTVSELAEIGKMTRREVIRDFVELISFFPEEVERYNELKPFLEVITTKDGYNLYVANSKMIAIGSNHLLGEIVQQEMRNRHQDYQRGTYADITFLAGKTIQTSFYRWNPEKKEEEREEFRFEFPPIPSKEVHIIFFDDMD